MREIDLRRATEFIDQYIELRNSYADILLTQPVLLKPTKEWLKKNKEVEVRGLVDDNGILLGVVILYLFRAGEVAILVREKKRGIGTQLLGMIEKVALEKELNALWAWVLDENIAAQRFFEKNDYKQLAKIQRNYNSRMFDGIKYQKIIATAPARDSTLDDFPDDSLDDSIDDSMDEQEGQ